MLEIALLKIQRVGSKESVYFQLLFRQPLLVEIVHQCFDDLAILFKPVGPRIIAENLLFAPLPDAGTRPS